MSTDLLFGLGAVALFVMALHGLFFHRHLLLKIIAANIAASSAFLFIVAVAGRDEAGQADPVPQALALTGIVIAISVTAFALSLLRRLVDETGQPFLGEDEP